MYFFFGRLKKEGAGTPVYRHYTTPTLDLLVIRELSSNCNTVNLVTIHFNHFLNINLVSKLLELLEFKIT